MLYSGVALLFVLQFALLQVTRDKSYEYYRMKLSVSVTMQPQTLPLMAAYQHLLHSQILSFQLKNHMSTSFCGMHKHSWCTPLSISEAIMSECCHLLAQILLHLQHVAACTTFGVI